MAKISGNVYRITNLSSFVASYVANPAAPTASTFTAATNCRVFLKHNMGDNAWGGPLPDVQTSPLMLNAAGGFSVDIGALNKIARLDGQLIVEELIATMNLPVVGTVQVWGVVYRSQPFEMSSISEAARKIYYHRITVPPDAYITQAIVNQAVAEAKSSLPAGVESLSALITNRGLSVSGAGRGAKITFRVELSGSRSHDLNVLLGHKIEDFDIDLPGPDAITSLCVDEDKIEAEVRKAVGTLVRDEVSSRIKEAVVAAASSASGLPASAVRPLLDSMVSLGVFRVTYPETGSFKIPGTNLTAKQHEVAIEPSIAVPRRLFG